MFVPSTIRVNPLLTGMEADMPVTLIGAPLGAGAGRRGAEGGPRALRMAGLREALSASGRSVRDLGDVTPAAVQADAAAHANAAVKALPEVANFAAALHAAVADLPADATPVILGGDHAVSLGSVPGLAARAARLGRPFFVLWIDAHPDCHTLDTTRSGHLHGIPVAHALGLTSHAPLLSPSAHPLPPAHLRMVGVRDVDAAERALLDGLGVGVTTPEALRAGRGDAGLGPWLERIRAVGGTLHVSLDADALDPVVAPGVGTPVAGGLSLQEAHGLLADIAAAGVLGSMELVEVNPFLDRDQRTARAMVELCAAAFSRPATHEVAARMGAIR
jgi:arginase